MQADRGVAGTLWDSAPVNSLSPYKELSRDGGSFCSLVWLFSNNDTTDKFNIVLSRLICRFVTYENPKNKRTVIYDPIGRVRV